MATIRTVASEADVRASGLPVAVLAGQAVKEIEIQLRPGGAITGRVLNEDGEPMANVPMNKRL